MTSTSDVPNMHALVQPGNALARVAAAGGELVGVIAAEIRRRIGVRLVVVRLLAALIDEEAIGRSIRRARCCGRSSANWREPAVPSSRCQKISKLAWKRCSWGSAAGRQPPCQGLELPSSQPPVVGTGAEVSLVSSRRCRCNSCGLGCLACFGTERRVDRRAEKAGSDWLSFERNPPRSRTTAPIAHRLSRPTVWCAM